jgi:hypothetical protein
MCGDEIQRFVGFANISSRCDELGHMKSLRK